MAAVEMIKPPPAAKGLTLENRAELMMLAAKLAAASGEDPIEVARGFTTLVAGSHHFALAMRALKAAVIEAAERREHLRARQPTSAIAVHRRALAMLAFLLESE